MFRSLVTAFRSQIVKSKPINPRRNIYRSATLNDSKEEETKEPEKKDEQPPKEEELVIVEREGPITLFGLNRPKCRNAINSATASQLCEAITKFEADDTSPVGVLYGIGGSFSAGYDINELGGKGDENVNIDMLMQAEGSVGPTRRHMKKPMICAINGYCVANGVELALMCDLRVMEDTAILGFFNRRFGVPVIDGGTARLPFMIGFSRALDLILTGRRVNAREAFEMGLVNRIVETGTSLGQAVNLAYCIAKFPQAALNHDRNSLYSAVYDSPNFDTSLQNEIMYTSKEIIEEIKAGVQKFHAGIGRSGSSTNIKEKTMADWEREEIRIEEEIKMRKMKKDKPSTDSSESSTKPPSSPEGEAKK